MQKYILWTILIAGVALFAGCATGPADTPELVRAREAYERALRDPTVRNNAPVALHDARKALQRGQEADSEAERVHYAYLVQRKVAMAEAAARNEAVENEIAELQERRESILVQSREQEVDIARQRAEEAQREAEVAQLEVERMREEQRQTEVRQYQQQAEQAREENRKLREELSQMSDATTEDTDRGIVLNIGDVLFETDQATLKPGATLSLGKLAKVLGEHPDRRVIIEGHTDSAGSAEYNRQLSQRRAEAVADFMRSQGVPEDRIMARGYGEAYPVTTNETVAGRQQNRRVEIVLMNEGSTFEQSVRETPQAGGEQGS